MNRTIHKIYKIRNKKTGLFSKGGSDGRDIWTKEGKSWSSLGHLKNHIALFIHGNKKAGDYPYEDAEIIEIEVNYNNCFKMDINEVLENMIGKRVRIEKQREEKYRKWREEYERKQLEELKKKYETNK
jgi:hypothetical protein